MTAGGVLATMGRARGESGRQRAENAFARARKYARMAARPVTCRCHG